MFLVPAYAAYPPALYDPAFFSKPLTTQPNPSNPNPPWIVQNCDDDGVGSLRHVITSVAQSGDTVDLSQLTCSAITLTTGGAIVVAQDDLTLIGPTAGSLTISGDNASRVFEHTGVGLLSLQYLKVANGYEHEPAGSPNRALGGCIYSAGSVGLYSSVVAGCTALSDDDHAQGGGIYVKGAATLEFSTVSGNSAISFAPVSTYGGGVRAYSLAIKYSSIANNTVSTAILSGHEYGIGGGASAIHGATVVRSTFDQNHAAVGGALETYGLLQISNSTISENDGFSAPALVAGGAAGVTISDSTIAFNHATNNSSDGAVVFNGPASTTFNIQSTTIGDNTAGPGNVESDLYVNAGSLTGAGNLVMTTNQSPPNFTSVTSDPKLGPLQFNGGRTKTRALLPGSPAISMGNNNTLQLYDQRGLGYPRTTGVAATTDIGAFQFDTIFVDPFD